MKKIYLITILITFSASVFSQTPFMPKRTLQKSDYASGIAPNRYPANPLTIPAQRTPVLVEDFEGLNYPELPAGWSTNDVSVNTGGFTPAFISGASEDANNGGFFPVPVLGDNHFAYANDDGPPCDCDMSTTFLDLPSLDLSTISNPSIAFDFFHPGTFGGGDAWVEVSNDGGANFTEVLRLSVDVNSPDFAADDKVWQSAIIPIFEFDGQTVIIRFNWSDGSSWAAGFAVDNIVVDEMAQVDVATSFVRYGNWDSDVLFGTADYTVIPISQVRPTPITGIMSNFGIDDVTGAVFNYTILKNDVELSSGTMDPLDLVSLGRDTVSIIDPFVPEALIMGDYTVRLEAVIDGDGKPENNFGELTFEVSNNVYGRDEGWRQAILNNFTAGAVLFDIYNDDVMTFVQVGMDGSIPDGETRTIFANVYEATDFVDGEPSVFSLLESTLEASVDQSDMNAVGESKWVIMEMENNLALEAGKTYAVELVLDNDLLLAVAGTTFPFLGAYVYTDDFLDNVDLDASGTATAIMVRMGVEETDVTGLNEIDKNLTLSQNIPNPAYKLTRINFKLFSQQNVSVIITDVLGKVVSNENLGSLPQGAHQYTFDVSNLKAGVYQYTILTENGRLTKTMSVIK